MDVQQQREMQQAQDELRLVLFHCFVFLPPLMLLLHLAHVLNTGGSFPWDPKIGGDLYVPPNIETPLSDMFENFKIYVYRPDGYDKTANEFDRTMSAWMNYYGKIITWMNASEAFFLTIARITDVYQTRYPDAADLLLIPLPPAGTKMDHKIQWCDTGGSGEFPGEGYLIDGMGSALMRKYPYKAHAFYIPDSRRVKPKKKQVAAYEEIGWPNHDKYDQGLYLPVPRSNTSSGTGMGSGDTPLLICKEMNPRAIEEVPLQDKNSIRVVCPPSKEKPFISYKDITLPMVVDTPPVLVSANSLPERTILGYWEGVCDTDISETLVEILGENRRFDVQCSQEYRYGRPEKLWTAKFCICPGGSSECITTSIRHKCVPVILADHPHVPFNSTLKWEKFSVIVKESEIYNLGEILMTKEVLELTNLQNNLQKVRRHFRWLAPPQRFGAFHMVSYDLYLEAQSCKMQRHHTDEPLKYSMPSYKRTEL